MIDQNGLSAVRGYKLHLIGRKLQTTPNLSEITNASLVGDFQHLIGRKLPTPHWLEISNASLVRNYLRPIGWKFPTPHWSEVTNYTSLVRSYLQHLSGRKLQTTPQWLKAPN